MDDEGDIADLSPAVLQLVGRAVAGEDVVIARDGTPLVRLVRMEPFGPRGFGMLKRLAGPEPEGSFDPLSGEEPALWYADVPPEMK